jgi:hypothetical protein
MAGCSFDCVYSVGTDGPPQATSKRKVERGKRKVERGKRKEVIFFIAV